MKTKKINLQRLCVYAGLCLLLKIPLVYAELDDLADGGPFEAGQEYRLSITGVIGTVADGYVLVTRIKPGSPVDGKVLPGDRLIRLQGISLAGNLAMVMRRHMTRLWRENDGRLALTFSRSGEEGASESIFHVRLHLPAPPGTIQHFGPMGIFAAILEDHIEITGIKDGSPADGTLRIGDRIVAIGGKPVHGDIYKLFTDQIELAEREAQDGQLDLQILRPSAEDVSGISLAKTLHVPVLGKRSVTSPHVCPKTDVLIRRAAEHLVASGNMGRLNIGLLGLLATGEEDWIDYVGQQLREASFAQPNIEISMSASMISWPWSYQFITLCEYYLLTGDDFVLPAIRTIAQTFAKGQDVAGLWNHRMAYPGANRGQYNGRLFGYGAINQTSAVLWIGLILAEKCGVDTPELSRAIEKTRRLYANWAGKGALPYGNHAAMEHILTNNGTSGSVAVGFALLGDAEAATFYARLSAASHGDIFTGHTGPFFNYLWSSLGANVLGPDVWPAYEREIGWLRTMTRVWDGSFQYMEQRGDIFDYGGLHSTGANLLTMSAGRRALHVTGKEMDHALWRTGEAADAMVHRPVPDSDMPADTLLKYLGNDLPPVRLEAAQALSASGLAEWEQPVLDMLRDGTREQRIGALHALRYLAQSDAAVELLLHLIKDDSEDPWVRELAIGTLVHVDAPARFAEALLQLLIKEKPYDHFGNLNLAIGRALVDILQPDPYVYELDSDLLYAATGVLFDHPHMWGRHAGMRLIEQIPLEEFYRVADQVMHIIHDADLTFTAYHADAPRQAGLELLNRLQIEEVLRLAVDTIGAPTGQGGVRRRNRMRLIRSFGREAEAIIPALRDALGDAAIPIIESIGAADSRRDMIPLSEAVQRGNIE